MCPSLSALLRRATVYYHMDKCEMAAEDLREVLKEEPHNPAATVGHLSPYMQVASCSSGSKVNSQANGFLLQKLLIETEKKLNEGQPVKQSKRIIIREVEEDDASKDGDMTEAGLFSHNSCLHAFILFSLSNVIALLVLF